MLVLCVAFKYSWSRIWTALSLSCVSDWLIQDLNSTFLVLCVWLADPGFEQHFLCPVCLIGRGKVAQDIKEMKGIEVYMLFMRRPNNLEERGRV